MGRMADQEFRTDLYRGTAEQYDSFRRPYPAVLTDDLAARTGADGTGSLLDLACSTGHVGFALRTRFASIWAVDQEPQMIRVAARPRPAPVQAGSGTSAGIVWMAASSSVQKNAAVKNISVSPFSSMSLRYITILPTS
jgi:trans-aconitate methyltransferase